MRPGAEPQARKHRRIIRWNTNTVRIFLAENEAAGRGSFATVERSVGGRLLGCKSAGERADIHTGEPHRA
jgi:hypothetical protein